MNICPNCGQYIIGSGHACFPRQYWPAPPAMYPPIHLPQPLSAEEIRKIVREELERAIPQPGPAPTNV